uniref:PHD-type domain-containing protein n=1 Tax=Opuntia streptacantha TaxID=393608 RepID=A0A7C9EC43_OPUST
MKRELAALEIGSPVLESTGGKTRYSKQRTGVDSDRVSEGLVYKRTRRSVQVAEVDVTSNRPNGVVDDLKDHGVRNSSVSQDLFDVADNALAEVAKREIGEVETACDDGVQNVGEASSVEMVEEGVNEGQAKELPPEESEGAGFSMEDNGVASNLSAEDNGLMNNVLIEDGGLSNSSFKEQHLMPEVGKVEVASGTLSVCPSNVVNEEMKNLSVEGHPKRFTRSALKSKVDNLTSATDSMVPDGSDVYEAMIEHNAEVDGARASSHAERTENNGEFKNSSLEQHSRRYTCSALKPKVEGTGSCLIEEASDYVAPVKKNAESVINDVNAEAVMENDVEESMSATPKRKLEMKMSKQIALANIPTTVKELFETALLEGCPVYYNGGKGAGLCGRIRGLGILCSCGLCQGRKVIPPSLFEIHACNSYKRAAQYICLENGRSFIQILKECKSTRLSTLEATVQNAIGPLPERKLVVCQNCKERFSTMDAETSEAVCSSCIMSNLSPIGPVFSYRKTCRSSKSLHPLRSVQAASSCGVLAGRSLENLIEKSSEASLMSKLQSSPRSPEVLGMPRLRSSPRFGKSSDANTTRKTAKKSLKPCLTPDLRSSPRHGKSSETMTAKKFGKITQESPMVLTTGDSPSVRKSSETRTYRKRGNSVALSPKLPGSTRVGKSLITNDHGKTRKRLRKEVMAPKASKSPSVQSSSEKRISGRITKKDLRQHRLVFEDDVLPDGTELGYYARGQKLLDGYKKGSGIFCNCCSTVVSASQFEAHAGCASRKKPYCYIYTSNGVSLHELSVNLIKGRTHSAKFNDDLCSICADGGNLLLCDGCPRSFHMQCASLPSIPCGKWYCKYCQNMFEREKFVAHNANAVAAGRVSGVDPMEQITKRSIRIVDNLASEVSSCILCRGYDFCKSGFGPRTIILCDQCEKEYHVGCLKDHNMADLTELPEGKWFCSVDCGRIDSALQNILDRGAEKLPESLMYIIRKKQMQADSVCAADFGMSWRLLSGKIASPETRPLLSQAVAIFHESFAPIIDTVSGHDLIPAMVYGRNVAGQEYAGMYCAVLTINSVVVSAGIFRVFGPEVAELPLVATSTGNHGKIWHMKGSAFQKNLALMHGKDRNKCHQFSKGYGPKSCSSSFLFSRMTFCLQGCLAVDFDLCGLQNLLVMLKRSL